MSDFNFIKQFTPEAFKEAMNNANRAKKLRFNHGYKSEKSDNMERPETITTESKDAPKKRGWPKGKKRKTKTD